MRLAHPAGIVYVCENATNKNNLAEIFTRKAENCNMKFKVSPGDVDRRQNICKKNVICLLLINN